LTAIPSESSILALKQKRERLRTTAKVGESDFISLSVTRLADERDEPHPESRLVREEDEMGEGEDGSCILFIREQYLD
jgi:GC-rich sequence DNA-binding factor